MRLFLIYLSPLTSKLEKPYDMLEWIWIHMAINAAVISVIGKNGDINDSITSVHKLLCCFPNNWKIFVIY